MQVSVPNLQGSREALQSEPPNMPRMVLSWTMKKIENRNWYSPDQRLVYTIFYKEGIRECLCLGVLRQGHGGDATHQKNGGHK